MDTQKTPSTATPKPIGRPREFDENLVLDKLLTLFWQRGFEATSLLDMVEATGLNKASLRNTFGSKHDIFERVLARYNERFVEELLAVLTEGKAGLADVHAFLTAHEKALLSEMGREGCFATNSAVELGKRDELTLSFHTAYRKDLCKALRQTLERAVKHGELTNEHVNELSNILVSVFFGLAVTGRSGGTKKELSERFKAVHALLDTWR